MRKATIDDRNILKEFVSRDYARSYFAALGLEKSWSTFKDIYMTDEAALFHRASGNLQYVSFAQDDSFSSLVRTLTFNHLIGSRQMCDHLGLPIERLGAYIAKLDKEDYVPKTSFALPIEVDDLRSIENLYERVFSGYPKADYMKSKLLSGRGIGFGIKKDDMVSVAQSDFYSLIVGVATHPNYVRQGYAQACLHKLLEKMFQTQRSVYLQYDDPYAGKLYEKLGFKVIDQVAFYTRS